MYTAILWSFCFLPRQMHLYQLQLIAQSHQFRLYVSAASCILFLSAPNFSASPLVPHLIPELLPLSFEAPDAWNIVIWNWITKFKKKKKRNTLIRKEKKVKLNNSQFLKYQTKTNTLPIMTQIFLYLKYNLQQHKYAKASPSQKKKKKYPTKKK